MNKIAAKKYQKIIDNSNALDERKKEIVELAEDVKTKLNTILAETTNSLGLTLYDLIDAFQSEKKEYLAELEEIKDAQTEYIDNKSDKWIDSYKGDAYSQWQQQWNEYIYFIEDDSLALTLESNISDPTEEIIVDILIERNDNEIDLPLNKPEEE